MKCADCRYWTPLGADPRFGDCVSEAFTKSYDRPPFNGVRVNGAIIENDEGWGWHTGRDFGCIHFQEKHGEENTDD